MNAPPSDSKTAPDDESSVLFSLTELMDLESVRVAEEEEAQQRARKRAQREREEQELLGRQQEQARLLALEREHRDLELRRKEEEARLAAISEAEKAKALHLAENEARLRLIAQTHEHEERLAAIREDQAKKRLRRWVVGSVVGAVAALTLGFVWVDGAKRDAAEKLAQFEREARERKRQVDEEIRRINEVKDRVSAKDQEHRAELERELRLLRRRHAELSGKRSGPGRVLKPLSERESPPPPPPPPPCEEGDPMCPL